jgi:hypothetical protein
MDGSLTELFRDRDLYHATPLHYLPAILTSGELLSQQLVGYDMARPTARARDRRLSVDQFVHFSLARTTPLLKHKLSRGYPHAVLQINIENLDRLTLAVLPCSTKAWRSTWQCRPVFDALDIARLVRLSEAGQRFPGIEILVQDRLSLESLRQIIVSGGEEADLVRRYCNRRGLCESVPVVSGMDKSRTLPGHLETIRDYFELCEISGTTLQPPKLPFD